MPAPRRRWRPRLPYLVAGTSQQATAVRSALLAAGHPGDGLRRPTVLVVGGSLDAMVAGDWRRRVDAGSGVRWRRVWALIRARDQLPAGSDLVALAQQHAQVWGDARVHVVLADDPVTAVDRAAGILGVRLGAGSPPPAHPVDTDLLRLVNQQLATKDPGCGGRQLSRPWPGGFGAPTAELDWAVDRGDDRWPGSWPTGRGGSTATRPSSYPRPTRGSPAPYRRARPWPWRSTCSAGWRRGARGPQR